MSVRRSARGAAVSPAAASRASTNASIGFATLAPLRVEGGIGCCSPYCEEAITFEPGSATIDDISLPTMNTIAEILERCGEIELEIQGHTDSQGRTSMNQQLSQDRAQAVLNELLSRRILTAGYTARGYGETEPIADNKTEEGREANRRIEFRLIRPEPVSETITTLEAITQTTSDADEEAAAADAPEPAGGQEESASE